MASPAPAGSVTTHETTISRTTLRSSESMLWARPTPRTAPTKVWVVEMGRPDPDAMTTVPAAASSAENPVAGGQVRNLFANGRHHSSAQHTESADDTSSTQEEDPRRHGGLCCHFTCVLENTHYGGQWANRIRDVIGPMRKCHPAGREDHGTPQIRSTPLNSMPPRSSVSLGIRQENTCR